jgi:hypothetical protein
MTLSPSNQPFVWKGSRSLKDMLEVDLPSFMNISQLQGFLDSWLIHNKDKATEKMDEIADVCAVWGDHCRALGLQSSASQVKRIESTLKVGCSKEKFVALLEEFQNRLNDEIAIRKIYMIPVEKAVYLYGVQFGDPVRLAFTSAMLDMDEAGTCYAMGRNTACVLHLQRVMEAGLRKLAELTVPESLHNPSWDAILSKIDQELAVKKREDRNPFFNKHMGRISESAALLRSVKFAWRNPAMHVTGIYDEDKALAIYSATVSFMRYLSEFMTELEN